ncbi:MAG: sulfite exporter TauE/SafE family protein [Bacteroidota bacterium]|nr:sulfite exporter TauE/SafE family protein [Bacteroidota bacterium]
MPELLTLLILYATGCFAGAVNVMAGGGSTLSLPVLIMLGVDAGVANGTNRIAITIQNVAATATFARERRVEWARCLRYAAWAFPGAIMGSFTATQLADEWTERVIGILLILVVLSMAWPAARKHTAGGALRSHWMGPALLGIGFYGGFIQMGVGFFFMAAFYHLMQFNLVRTNIHKVVVILLYTGPTLLVFALSGKVDWGLGLALAAGNATGAILAARLAIRRGEKAIRLVLMIAVVLMAMRLLSVI